MLFTASFGSVSSTYTNICINVTHLILFNFSFIYSIIYALYSLSGLSLAHVCLLTDFYTNISYMLFTASMGLSLAHILTCLSI